jgi:hypothetical protein
MLTTSRKPHGSAPLTKLATLAAVGAALAWTSVDATAARRLDAPRPTEVRATRVQDADLERLFWICDHAAAVRMVNANEHAVCSAITEQLKKEKFGGDFESMLSWWRTNKIIQHQRLDADDESGAAQ